MNGSIVDLFAQRGGLVEKDVTPWQTFSGKGMKFRLQSYDWAECACLAHLSMKGLCGLMKMESVICTPYGKDVPLFSYDGINVFGRRTVFLELYDTQVEPIDLSALDAVKLLYKDLKDKAMKPAWYDGLKLSPSTYKVGRGQRMCDLVNEMMTAYLDLFVAARVVDRAAKTEKNRRYVEGLIGNGGPAVNVVRGMLGKEAAETMFRRFLFGTV